MRFLRLSEVLYLHRRILAMTGGADGIRKRIGHASMEMFLRLNGYALEASVDEQERVVLALASGAMQRDELLAWLERHAVIKNG